jgi:hypothetical protein
MDASPKAQPPSDRALAHGNKLGELTNTPLRATRAKNSDPSNDEGNMRAAAGKAHRTRSHAPPAALLRTAQSVKKAPVLRNLLGNDPTLSKVPGRVKRRSAIRATLAASGRTKIEIDLCKERKKACIECENGCRRGATTPYLCCRTRLCANKFPGPACSNRPRGSRLLYRCPQVTQSVVANKGNDSDLDS